MTETLPPDQPFELDIDIVDDDIDMLGHVNNVVNLRWVQEAAIAHWRRIATEQEQRSLLWVVSRHEIDYRRPAFDGDGIVARTWIGGTRGRAFERHTEILRRKDRKTLARALTLWRPVDPDSLRPVEVDTAVRRRFSTQVES
jgi:acyl-CoA thioester hydrolase